MSKARSWRGGVALGLIAALLMTSFGCQPAATSTPANNKPAEQKPDNKDKTSGQPKPDPG